MPFLRPRPKPSRNGRNGPAGEEHTGAGAIRPRDSQILRRFAVGSATNSASRGISLITWFFLTPFILHHLGVAAYGLWIVVGSVVAYGSLLDFGIAGAVTRFVAQYRALGDTKSARAVAATALRLYIGLGLVALLATAGLAAVFSDIFNLGSHDEEAVVLVVLLMGLTVAVALPANSTSAVLQGLHRYDLTNFTGTIGNLSSAAATVIVLLAGGGLVGMVAVNIPARLMTFVLNAWLINRVAPDLGYGWNGARRDFVRPILSFSLLSFVMNVAWQVQSKTDEIVIGIAMSVSAVAPYALARKLSEAAMLVTNEFVKVLLPIASQLDAEDDRERLRWVYVASTRLTLLILLPVACVLVLLGGDILSVWVGPQFAIYSPVVTILTLAGVASVIQWAGSAMVMGMGRHRRLAVAAAAGAVLNLALSVALVGPLGLTGVALGTLIPAALESFVLVGPYILRTVGIDAMSVIRRAILPASLPLLPMAILVTALGRALQPVSLVSVVVVSAAGLAVYLLAYLLVGASPAERQLMRSVLMTTRNMTADLLRRSS